MPERTHRRLLGEILVDQGVLTEDRLRRVTESGLLGDRPIGRVLVGRGWATFADVARALALQSGRPYVPPDELQVRHDELKRLQRKYLRSLQAIPVEGKLPNTFAVASPGNLMLVGELERMVEGRVDIVVTDEDALESLLQEPDERFAAARRKGSTSEGRTARRVHCPLDLECFYAFFGLEGTPLFAGPYRGEVKDISRGGGRISGSLPVDADRKQLIDPSVRIKCNVFVRDQSQQAPIRLAGSVRWIEKGNEFIAQFGVAWKPAAEADRVALDRIMVRIRQSSRRGESVSLPKPGARRPDLQEPPDAPSSLDVWGGTRPR